MGGPAVRRDVMPPLRGGGFVFGAGPRDCACPGLFSFGPSGASLPEFVTMPRRRFARQLIWALSGGGLEFVLSHPCRKSGSKDGAPG